MRPDAGGNEQCTSVRCQLARIAACPERTRSYAIAGLDKIAESCRPILSRSCSIEIARKAEARSLIDAACPLLRELVNHATLVYVRCSRAPDRDRIAGENEGLAPAVLYQQIIELTDSLEVLMSESCVNGAVPLLRSAFEAILSKSAGGAGWDPRPDRAPGSGNLG